MSFGITELIVILAIVVLLFGTKKLKTLGTDLGSAIKGFKKAITTEEENTVQPTENESQSTATENESQSTATSAENSNSSDNQA